MTFVERTSLIAGLLILSTAAPGELAPHAGQGGSRSVLHDVTVTARRYAFTPARIEVKQGDILRITLVVEDTAHSFTIDEYRICKRAAPGRPVTFEFCADRAGRFVFYCSLTAEEGCRHMRGELVVN